MIELHTQLNNYAIGELATAIETHGIHGWDRFGRLKHFNLKDNTPEIQRVLDGLADQFSWELSANSLVDSSPADAIVTTFREGPPPWPLWGWLEGEVPDLGAVVEKPKRQAEITKRDDILYTVIAACLAHTGININERGAVAALESFMKDSDFKHVSDTVCADIVKKAREAVDRRPRDILDKKVPGKS
jgi:hypothetical protein